MSLAKIVRMAAILSCAVTLSWLLSRCYGQSAGGTAAGSGPPAPLKDDPAAARLSHGKKLVLKDGNFQLVRSYERKGERVRYYSVERGDWEEVPAAMVDWDATEKAQIEDEKAAAALVKRVQAQEQGQRIISVVDIDASLPVAPGVFLPMGEGMFVVAGKSVIRLDQVGSQVKADKKRVFEQVISPVPIIPSKHNVEIPGTKAKIRVMITAGPPEFYLREAAPDPENPTSIQRSSRQGVSGPEIELVRATVKGNKRRLEATRSLMGQELAAEIKTIAIQRWEVAQDVYRFTISEPLPPGEYALAEVLPDGMNLSVWDFGVDSVVMPQR